MKAKLVIWDLDDTLWQGTLAEGDAVEVYEERVDLIRKLNACGVVNSICSKNDFSRARQELESRGLWDLFVFPEIAFEPKGALVKRIIKDMQLRAPDVIFIDDNHLNLREVEHENASIRVVDATTSEANELLERVLKAYEGKNKSRVEEYRILEKKRGDAKRLGLDSNEAFLSTCEIKVCIVERTDNLRFAQRIEELINRTNQLNFLKTRVAENSMSDYIVQSTKHDTYSVFVWDKYGYYGLVGFAAVEKRAELKHFAFSCRVMNMGIENALATHIKRNFPSIETPVSAIDTPWIEFVDVNSDEFRSATSIQEQAGEELPVRIMANCQSGSIAHYMGLRGLDWDNWPRVFSLGSLFKKKEAEPFKKLSIYGAFNDYSPAYWGKMPSVEEYRSAVDLFLDAIPEDGGAIILLPPENFVQNTADQSPELYAEFNNVWRTIAREQSKICVIDVFEIAPSPALVRDPRHYSPEQLMALSRRVRTATEAFLRDGSFPRPDSEHGPQVNVRFLAPALSQVSGASWCIYAEANSRLGSVEVQGTVYIGFGSSMLSGVIRSYAEIGRYCSIGRGVLIGVDPIRTGMFSDSPFFDFVVEKNAAAMVSLMPKRRIVIGSDCRIGDGAVLESGVTIGHGAVILPNSHVSRDVAPYEIIGTDGQSLGYRFDKDVCDRLLESNWWEKDPSVVKVLVSESVEASLQALNSYSGSTPFPQKYQQIRNI